jgi:hypothetical protein
VHMVTGELHVLGLAHAWPLKPLVRAFVLESPMECRRRAPLKGPSSVFRRLREVACHAAP